MPCLNVRKIYYISYLINCLRKEKRNELSVLIVHCQKSNWQGNAGVHYLVKNLSIKGHQTRPCKTKLICFNQIVMSSETLIDKDFQDQRRAWENQIAFFICYCENHKINNVHLISQLDFNKAKKANLMGNNCVECPSTHVESGIKTIRLPKDPEKPAVQRIEDVNFEQLTRRSTIEYISRIKIDKAQLIKISIMNGDKVEKILISMQKMKTRYAQYKEENPKYSIYCVQMGSYEGNIKEGPIIELAIIKFAETNKTSVIAFAGKYQGSKKSKGLYLFLKADEAFMFQGIFDEKNSKGVKVILGKDMFQKSWGIFNSKFQLDGHGTNFLHVKSDDSNSLGQYFCFSGLFKNGKKEGKGLCQIRQETDTFKPKRLSIQKMLQPQRVFNVQSLLQRNIDKDLSDKVIELIDALSKYVPPPPPIIEERDCKLVIDGCWKNNLIEGSTEERWPQKHYRFCGEYKRNQRNGFGEEYAYSQKIAKGFYKKSLMEKDKDNEFLLLGFKLMNGQWKRTVQ